MIKKTSQTSSQQWCRCTTRRSKQVTAYSFANASILLSGTDILITDVNLKKGGQTGKDLVRLFRSMNPKGFVILVSGTKLEVSSDADAVFLKPFFTDDVINFTQRAVRTLEER